MRKVLSSIATLTALLATDAAAQVEGVDLNGVYRCVAQCLGGPGSFAHITLVIFDAMDEERFLVRNLPGYADYQNRVRYRLLPLIW